MKRNTLFYASCIATASNNISSLHSATILTHTIARSYAFFSETKYCYSRSDVKSQLVPFSTIPRSWTWKRAILQTLKTHTKLTKIGTTIFFAVVIRRKRKFTLAKTKIGGGGLVAL